MLKILDFCVDSVWIDYLSWAIVFVYAAFFWFDRIRPAEQAKRSMAAVGTATGTTKGTVTKRRVAYLITFGTLGLMSGLLPLLLLGILYGEGAGLAARSRLCRTALIVAAAGSLTVASLSVIQIVRMHDPFAFPMLLAVPNLCLITTTVPLAAFAIVALLRAGLQRRSTLQTR